MRVIRLSLPVLSVMLAVLVPTSAGAAPRSPRAEAQTISSRLTPVRETVSSMRATLADGNVGAAIRAGAIAAEREDAIENLPLPAAAPATLEDAVTEIVAAVRQTDAVAKRGPAADLPAWVERAAMEAAIRGEADPEAFGGIEPVDPAPALRSAALIARAVDRAMPALRAAAAALPPGPAGADCDVVDQGPVCVGGTGDNTHVKDAMVSIDLGGNDTYTNDAGFVSVAAQLVVDLTGTDTYAADVGTGHAYANTGGVAILVDAAGDDRYILESQSAPVGGQGVGILGGVGVLVDGAGNDVYRQHSEVEGAHAGAGGMGEGVLGGVGVLVDGGGNDVYSGTASMDPVLTEGDSEPALVGGYSLVTVGGVGIFGAAGLMADAGGTDSFSADARMAPAPPDGPPVLVTQDRFGNIEQRVAASGWGIGSTAGAGYLLEGSGSTEYTVRAEIGPVPLEDPNLTAMAVGQGNAVGGLAGALSDAGGDDRYTVEVSTTTAVSRWVDDACGSECVPARADVAAAPVIANVQGFGGLGSVGLMDDAGGNDVYEVRVATDARATAHDHRTEAGTSRISGNAAGGPATLHAQGAGVQGLGVLSDATGDDVYQGEATTRSETEGTSTIPANDPDLSAFSGTPSGLAQGVTAGLGGAGALVDLGGSDAYATSAAGESVLNGNVVPGPAVVEAQAAAAAGITGLGLLLDLDGVGTDTFATAPDTPACSGIRGEGAWRDCGTHGIGLNG